MKEEKIIIKADHLDIGQIDPDKQALLNDIGRIGLFHMYPQAREILHINLLPLFHEAVNNSSTRGMITLLYGNINTGKSYLLEYMKEYVRYKKPHLWKPSRHPIWKMDLSDNIRNAKEFYLCLLAQLESPIDANRIKVWKDTNSTEINLRKRLIATLERFHTRILVLDECQRLVQAKSPNIPNIFEAVKDLSNKSNWNGDLRTQLVFCGTDQAYSILEAAHWIQGRIYGIRLSELNKQEYSEFLREMYRDYVTLGVSEKWNLIYPDPRTGVMTLDLKVAKYLFKKTDGKVGLTGQIFKKTFSRALNSNREFPILADFQKIIEMDKDIMIDPNCSINKKRKRKKILIQYQDSRCKIKGCANANIEFFHHSELLNHYRTTHPEYKLFNKDGHEIR